MAVAIGEECAERPAKLFGEKRPVAVGTAPKHAAILRNFALFDARRRIIGESNWTTKLDLFYLRFAS